MTGYESLTEDMAVVELARDVVRVTGEGSERYLQGQLSQDVARLEPGQEAWSLVLEPQGKLDALVRVYREGAGSWLLETDAGVGGALVERLKRFLLRTRADVVQLDWRALGARGPAAGSAPGLRGAGRLLGPGTEVVVGFEWNGLCGFDLLGPAPEPPSGAAVAGPEDYEAVRVEAGFPRHGAELSERTIPAEAGLVEASVSFKKGCYTGQELVARIDARGNNVARRLWGMLLSGPASAGDELHVPGPAPGAEVEVRPRAEGAGPASGRSQPSAAEPASVGSLTSVAFSPRRGWVALGYARRSVLEGAELQVGRSTVTARVSALPLSAPGR